MQSPGNPNLWRTLLILGRVSNLPTVWSNCIAGWYLAGGGESGRLILLCASGTLLYTAGMFLNDACDSGFDARHRPERPIPRGDIRGSAVWTISAILFVTGLVSFAYLGPLPFCAGLGLTAAIVFYDLVHKKTAWSPLLMALCRFLLYLTAAASATKGPTKESLWSASALALYIVGLSLLAKRESSSSSPTASPGTVVAGIHPARMNPASLLLLIAPLVSSATIDGLPSDVTGWIVFAFFIGWLGWCVRPLHARQPGAIGRAVSGLLAGIVVVDMVALRNSGDVLIVLLLLFAGALILQRKFPAT